MLEFWSKANSRRTAIRENRPDAGAFWRRLRAKGALVSIGIAVVFFAVLALLLMLRTQVVHYRPGEYVPHDVTARVDFDFFDKDLHDRQVKVARDATPRVYVQNNSDLWNSLETYLLALPDRVHDSKLDQLPQDFRSILDNGALTQLELVRTGADRKLYADDVRQFIGFAKKNVPINGGPLVILAKNQYDQEIRDSVDKATPRISIREKITQAGTQTYGSDEFINPLTQAYSTDLSNTAVLKNLEYDASSFDLALASKIARIAYARLENTPTYQLNDQLTELARNAAGDTINKDYSQADEHYQRNAVIVQRGTVNEHDWQLLKAENDAYHKSLTQGWKGYWQYRLGLAGIALIITVILSAYVARYQSRCVRNHTRGIAMCTLLLSMLLLTQLAGIGSNSIYIFGIAPTILVAMILTTAYDQRFALGVSTVHAFIVTAALNQNLGFFLVLWTGVLTACYLLDEIRTRSKLIEVGGAVAMAMMFVTAAIGAVELDPFRFILFNCIYTGAAGLATGFVVLGILPFIEKTFRITTAMTLLELADVSQPLLRRLAMEAPGTYSHSLQVATLAEAAAEAIGANSLSCRVGAYYHDVGKINKADYFVENQLGGPSRHLNLSPDLSLKIIIGHVKDGAEMAKEYNLPSSILPFIQQHHGTTLVEYFYHQAQEKNQEDQPSISEYHFRYPGPKPRSKETAILMVCDCVESASRTMGEPTASRIEKLVHELALKRLLDGQFGECDLTMRDLEKIERALVKTLLGIYHGRIAYPVDKPVHRQHNTGGGAVAGAIKSA